MNDVIGFCYINENATTCKGAVRPAEFIGKRCPVMEFASDGGVLVLNPEGTALAMFDKQDVKCSFRCAYEDGVVIPPDLNFLDRIAYMQKAKSRKGGYNKIVTTLVIEASLIRGEFTDSLLWAKQ
ncbi:MAG: hypothetical protein QG594_747 [Bacteroidota bacterium]|nr:hypothetical protein [Bacteroidota bacterium]